MSKKNKNIIPALNQSDAQQNSEIIEAETEEKAVETSLKLYGETNPAKSQIVKDRCHATVLERYGVDNVMHNSEIKDKFLDTVHSRTPERQQEINRTREETCLEIYGVLMIYMFKLFFTQRVSA